MRRLAKYDSTKMMSFSLYPTTVKSMRSLSGDFGSLGRAVQVAVELLYERAQREQPLEGSGLSSVEEQDQDLKQSFSFSVLPRTQKIIEWLSHPKRYGSRNRVLSARDSLLYNLHAHFFIYRK